MHRSSKYTSSCTSLYTSSLSAHNLSLGRYGAACALSVMLLLVIILSLSQNLLAAQKAQAAQEIIWTVVSVAEDETLTDYAKSSDEYGVTQAQMIELIKEKNGRSTAAVFVGEKLLIPEKSTSYR